MPPEEVAAAPESPPSFRVFFIPFFVRSHMNPITDIACAFAARGVDSAVVVTPANGALIRRKIERAAASGLPIRALHYPFPSAEVGLPPGVENQNAVAPGEESKLFLAVDSSTGALERLLREYRPRAVVLDGAFWRLTYVAKDLGIAPLVCHPFGAFPLVVGKRLMEHKPWLALADGDNAPFLVPGLPDEIKMVKSELPEFLRTPSLLGNAVDGMNEADRGSFGVVLSTFYDLEPAYCELFRRNECRRGFFVGPCTILSKAKGDDLGEEGKGELGENCLAWLDTQETASVVFVGFGSYHFFDKEQHWEMARGLEAAGRPFLWALKERDCAGGSADWLPEGFEERTRTHGLVFRGWTPQLAILCHRATGAFVTHLGWNSFTEGLYAGLPMITWPLAFDQFITERLAVNVMRIGVRMWDGYRSSLRDEAAKAIVKAEAISRVVARFRPPGSADEEIEELRKRAASYSAATRAAVKEGGAAYNDLTLLIDALEAFEPEA